MPKRSFYIKDSELDEDQIKIIQIRTNRSFIVKGCAGSGKSILALWKVKQIQEEKMGSYYFIVFTKTLRQYMKDGITQVGLSEDRVLYYNEWKNKGCPTADYIVVDEVQDFNREQVLQFKNSSNIATILYGDSAQQIYKFLSPKPLSIEEIQIETKYPYEQLIRNHRLPKTIAKVAEYISEDDDLLVLRCENEGTEKPKILRYNSLNDQLDSIIQIIKNRNFEDVGIFFPKNPDVEYAVNYFSKKGLNVEAKFDKEKKTINTLNFNSDNPKITTYHSAKGLQFEAVFIPNCSTNDTDKQSTLYVAITRSYQSLYIMYNGTISTFFDKVPPSLYDTSITGQTGARL
jgi:DNA helicase IV